MKWIVLFLGAIALFRCAEFIPIEIIPNVLLVGRLETEVVTSPTSWSASLLEIAWVGLAWPLPRDEQAAAYADDAP